MPPLKKTTKPMFGIPASAVEKFLKEEQIPKLVSRDGLGEKPLPAPATQGEVTTQEDVSHVSAEHLQIPSAPILTFVPKTTPAEPDVETVQTPPPAAKPMLRDFTSQVSLGKKVPKYVKDALKKMSQKKNKTETALLLEGLAAIGIAVREEDLVADRRSRPARKT
jgi:hypothetical protein